MPENGWKKMSNCNQTHFKMFLFRLRYYKNIIYTTLIAL